MGCRVYLVRHGETTWNSLLKFQGQTDIPLSDLGRQQARLLARRLSREKFQSCFASDLTRASETAEILAEPHGLSVQKIPALRELNFGAWEGLTIPEIKKLFDEEIKQWWSSPLTTRVPKGETLAEMVERSTLAIKKIIDSHSDGNVLVVSHGGAIRSIVGCVLGMDLNQYWRLKQDNASLNIVDFPEWEKGILMLFNDRSHLYQIVD